MTPRYLFIGFISFIFTVIFVAFITFLVYQVQSSTQGVFEGLEDKLYETRMLYSPSCFAYHDDVSGRTYSGIIDLNKVNDVTVRKCLPLVKNSERAIRIELVYKTKDGITKAIGTTTSNFEKVNRQKIISHNYQVIVKDNGPGELIFTHII